MLITLSYIKGGTPAHFFWRGGLQWRGLHFFLFFIKFYWLMLLYPGELYRLLQRRIHGGGIGKNSIFCVKSWFFHTEYPKIFSAPPLTWNPGSAPVLGASSSICIIMCLIRQNVLIWYIKNWRWKIIKWFTEAYTFFVY